ncbi:Chlorophyllase enzyme [Actinokineospora alba]|uniref:Chlorophyllase enzyme n=1 Tax=Actinokineospora alba TaxID=504798 RepID=A0A1H0KKP9_9PSEU|nr:acetylxylan esterase [Actinokineospora alba]TDP67863.1 chlorophyllase-like protein [Actinokineospora alba]SDH87807.1 Chlorophyllase enzyme [Actinokineospora alba]SDO56528.1 Chlorophyllase enzyme [Actinokineospora alba]
MRKRLIAIGFVAAIAAAVPVVGQAMAAECPPAPSDWAAPGPYPVTVEAGGNAHTLYRPTQLGGCGTHAVIIWGNGTGATPTSYDALLRHFASHGFIVAAANTKQSGSGREMLAGLDYLATRNTTPGDAYAGKVDLTKVAATGHSQGGGGAIAAGADPRVDTTVPIEPGPQGNVAALHGPTFFLAGQLDWIVSPQLLVYPRYQKATHIPAVYGELAGAGHFTAARDGGGFRGPITAWFRAQLLGDDRARAEFSGPSCGYCASRIWSRFERNALAR